MRFHIILDTLLEMLQKMMKKTSAKDLITYGKIEKVMISVMPSLQTRLKKKLAGIQKQCLQMELN